MVMLTVKYYEIVDKIAENIKLRKMRADLAKHSPMERDEVILAFLEKQIALGANYIIQMVEKYNAQKKAEKAKDPQ